MNPLGQRLSFRILKSRACAEQRARTTPVTKNADGENEWGPLTKSAERNMKLSRNPETGQRIRERETNDADRFSRSAKVPIATRSRAIIQCGSNESIMELLWSRTF